MTDGGQAHGAVVRNRPAREVHYQITINMLPEDALLAIFGFYLDGSDSKATSMMNLKNRYIESWHMLVHVCQKWQIVVFRSPHCLNLQLHCTPGTLAKRMLDVWPTLPIVMHRFGLTTLWWGMHNIITALEHIDRIQFVRAMWQYGKFVWRSYCMYVAAGVTPPRK